MPLQPTQKHNALSLEAMWMKRLQSSLNVRRGHKGVNWRLLRRVGGTRQRHTAKELKTAVHHALSLRRDPTPLHAALNLLIASKTAVDKQTHYRLYQKTRDRLKRATGVWLPYRLPVPYPQSNGTEARELRRDFKSLTDLMPVPGIIRKYINSVMCPIGVKGPSVKQVLCASNVSIPWHKVQKFACSQCTCSQLPASIPRIDGCAVIRGAEAISTVFPDLKHMLLQSAKNATIPLPSDVADKVKLQRKLVHRVLPGMPEDVHYAIDHLLLTNVVRQWSAVRQAAPWFCHEDAIRRVKRTLSHK